MVLFLLIVDVVWTALPAAGWRLHDGGPLYSWNLICLDNELLGI